MKIAVDLQACQTDNSKNRGIGRYSLSFAKALVGASSTHQFQFLLNRHYPETIHKIKNEIISIKDDILWKEYIYPLRGKRYDREVAQELISFCYHRTRAALLHISSVFEEDAGKAAVPKQPITLKNIVSSVTLYDLIPLVYKDFYLYNSEVKKWYYEKLSVIKNTDLLLAISESTRQDAINYLNISPNAIVNISAGVDSIFQKRNISPEEKNQFLSRYKLSDKFILYTGGIDYRKNIEKAIDAYACLPSDLKQCYPFVIVCAITIPQKTTLLNYVKQKGLSENNVLFTGFVSEEDLVFFYNLCSLFVFPSFYEGFGLPVLEAMSCGAPVIGSNSSSIPEIINFKEALFNPHSSDEMANRIQFVLQNNDFREQLISHGLTQANNFSWKRTAELAVMAFEEAEARKKPKDFISVSQFLPRRKIAYFSPLPDARSGIAGYSASLLPYLSRHFDIDLYVEQDVVSDEWLTSNFKIFHWREFSKRCNDYAEIIYQMGNSQFHAYMYDLLQQYPGIVVLHDFFLSGLLWYMENNMCSPNFFLKTLEFSHDLQQSIDIENAINLYPCNRRVLASAKGIIVHSSYVIELTRKFYGKDQTYPFKVIPHLREVMPDVSMVEHEAIRARYGFSESDFIICSFGFLAPTKLNYLLAQAFLSSPLKKIDNVKLIFVGQLQENTAYTNELLTLIKASGLQNRIMITGYVDNIVYEEYCKMADFAVQLRASSRGESSWAVLDCLSHGLPVIVNAYATFNDYSDDAVYKIPASPSVEDLSIALKNLYDDKILRQNYSEKGKAYVIQRHKPADVAAQYALAIQEFMEFFSQCSKEKLAKKLAEVFSDESPTEKELVDIATLVEEYENG